MIHRFAFGTLRPLLTVLGTGPRHSSILVDEEPDGPIEVAMGWAFRARIPRSSIVGARRSDRRPWSIGVHGWRGRWLVNGARDPIVVVDIDPPARARVAGVPVRLVELSVSALDPDALVVALGPRHDDAPRDPEGPTS